MIAFTIPLDGWKLLTPNTRRRMHHMAQARVTKAQRQMVSVLAPKGTREAVKRDIHLTLVRGKGEKMIDPDAIPTALKGVLDQIVANGLLYDDSALWCNPVYEQIRGSRPELRVVIEEAA